MSHSVDYSTLTTPSSTLIPSSTDLTEAQRQHVRDHVGDFARFIQNRDKLSNEQRNQAADELLQILGLVPTPYEEFVK